MTINTAHALYMADNYGKNTGTNSQYLILVLLFTATIVTRTRHNVTLYYITCLVFQPSSKWSFSRQNLYAFLFSVRNATCPSRTVQDYTLWSSLLQPVNFSLFKPRTMLSNTLSLSFPLNVTQQLSYPTRNYQQHFGFVHFSILWRYWTVSKTKHLNRMAATISCICS